MFLLINKTILLNLLYIYKIFIILNFVKMSSSSSPSIDLVDNNDFDARTLPRIGGVHKDVEICDKVRLIQYLLLGEVI